MSAGTSTELQCGRIYKDAEIPRFASKPSQNARLLQCGRIYKDAEIEYRKRLADMRLTGFNVAASIKMRKSCPYSGAVADHMGWLQCGRIYKDAEMMDHLSTRFDLNSGFNVAASIKMRKSAILEAALRRQMQASMWPHL